VKYPSRYEAFCFLIENEPGYRIGHSADLGAPTDLAPLLAKGLDLLVCELSHFTPEALFHALRGASVQRVLLTHVGRDWFQEPEALLKKARAALPKMEVELARDGMQVPLHCRQ
jgi:ribonuclease BN (tRNA processing enzyme)